MKRILYQLIFLVIVGSSMTSCVEYGELVYFRKDVEVERPAFQQDSINNLIALKIQKNDVLSITVSTFDPQLSAPFNIINSQMGGNVGASGSVSPLVSYIIDENGQIDYPVLGKLSLEGLSVSEAKTLLIKELNQYLKDPVVNIRIVSFRISVLGEVNRPGTFIINNDRITVLEALGMAGDLTAYSNRVNILVVREQNGVRKFGELDIQDRDIFRSEFFYLKQGDVIYVEPTEDKVATVRDRFTEFVPWITAGLQTVTTAIALIKLFE